MLCLFEKFVGFGVWVWHIRQAYQTRVPGSKIDEYRECTGDQDSCDYDIARGVWEDLVNATPGPLLYPGRVLPPYLVSKRARETGVDCMKRSILALSLRSFSNISKMALALSESNRRLDRMHGLHLLQTIR
jgi:hypothetical protein